MCGRRPLRAVESPALLDHLPASPPSPRRPGLRSGPRSNRSWPRTVGRPRSGLSMCFEILPATPSPGGSLPGMTCFLQVLCCNINCFILCSQVSLALHLWIFGVGGAEECFILTCLLTCSGSGGLASSLLPARAFRCKASLCHQREPWDHD